MNRVHQFWEQQAETYDTSDRATAPDHHYRLLEIEQIISHLAGSANILDVGCGNGFSTIKFKQAKPSAVFTGIDFSPSMIAAAKTAALEANVDVTFHDGNVLHIPWPEDQFDCVITERCLINLSGWDEQKKALMELKRVVTHGGRMIVVENTLEGLAGLNHIRKKFSLPEIKQRWHNRYIPHTEFVHFVQDNGLAIQCEKNIGNTYYLVSRVLHAKMAALEGKEPAYDHIINELAAKLPTTPHYHYSPNVLWVLRKN